MFRQLCTLAHWEIFQWGNNEHPSSLPALLPQLLAWHNLQCCYVSMHWNISSHRYSWTDSCVNMHICILHACMYTCTHAHVCTDWHKYAQSIANFHRSSIYRCTSIWYVHMHMCAQIGTEYANVHRSSIYRCSSPSAACLAPAQSSFRVPPPPTFNWRCLFGLIMWSNLQFAPPISDSGIIEDSIQNQRF